MLENDLAIKKVWNLERKWEVRKVWNLELDSEVKRVTSKGVHSAKLLVIMWEIDFDWVYNLVLVKESPMVMRME